MLHVPGLRYLALLRDNRRWSKLEIVGEENIRSGGFSRRRLLVSLLGAGASAPFTLARRGDSAGAASLSPEDNQFLEDLEKASFLFFWDPATPQPRLVHSRSNVPPTQPSLG